MAELEPAAGWEDLLELMRRLRGDDGCPWDRAQDVRSLKTYVLEETYELLEAMEHGDWGAMRGELGDLLFQIVFLAQMASERNAFDIAQVVAAIHAKMVERHPHVFGDEVAHTAADVLASWEKRKQRLSGDGDPLASVPDALPALAKAHRMTAKAAHLGFDWERPADVLDKIGEELGELREAVEAGEQQSARVRDEFGDLLFALVNLGRKLGVDAEDALQSANRRFRRRFAHIAATLQQQGRTFEGSTLADLDALWDAAKLSGL